MPSVGSVCRTIRLPVQDLRSRRRRRDSTVLRMSSMISSGWTFSAWPSKLRISRCRRAGVAHGSQVFAGDVVAMVQDGPDLGGQDDRLRAARARAVAHEPPGLLARQGVLGVTGQHERDAVAPQVVGDRDSPGQPRKLDDPLAVEDRLGVGLDRFGRAVEDRLHLRGGRELDQQLEEEPVELRFGERVGSFHLERVLGRQHEERRRQHVRRAGDGDRPLLHRLEQGRLGLGRGPVDLVGQDQVGEDRPALELEPADALGRLEHHVGADQVGGHQVGRELDALKLELEGVGQRADQQRLAQAGHALEQHVAAGDQGRQRLLDDLGEADDHLAHFAPQQFKVVPEPVELLPHFIRHAGVCHGGVSSQSVFSRAFSLRKRQSRSRRTGISQDDWKSDNSQKTSPKKFVRGRAFGPAQFALFVAGAGAGVGSDAAGPGCPRSTADSFQN